MARQQLWYLSDHIADRVGRSHQPANAAVTCLGGTGPYADAMGSTAVAFKPHRDDEDPMTSVQQWTADEYPPMGNPVAVRDLINSWIHAAGLGSQWRDDTSGVILPDGVEALSFQIHDNTVRAIWITRPTGELLELLCRCGRQAEWRVFDADSETEYLLSDFT